MLKGKVQLFLLTLTLVSCREPAPARNEHNLHPEPQAETGNLAQEKDAEPDLFVEITDESESLLPPLSEDISESAIHANKCYVRAALAFAYPLQIHQAFLEEVEETFNEKGLADASKQYWNNLQGALSSQGGTLDLEVIQPLKRVGSRFAIEKEHSKATNAASKAGSQQDANEFLFDILLLGKKDEPFRIRAEQELKVTRTLEKPAFPLEGFRFFLWQLSPEVPDLETFLESDGFDSLKALLVHYGTAESGHWVTYLKEKDQWYKVDDGNLEPVTLETVRQDFVHAELALLESGTDPN